MFTDGGGWSTIEEAQKEVAGAGGVSTKASRRELRPQRQDGLLPLYRLRLLVIQTIMANL